MFDLLNVFLMKRENLMKSYRNDGYKGNLVAASTSAILYLFGVGNITFMREKWEFGKGQSGKLILIIVHSISLNMVVLTI